MNKFLFLIAVLASNLAAQASPPVDPLARVYRDIDRLSALGLIDHLIVGQRPFSQREIVRLLQEAERNLAACPTSARDWATHVIAADLARYDLNAPRPFDRIDVGAALLSSPDRPAPSDANGFIDANINPLESYREGRPLDDGSTFIAESRHSITLGRHVALWASPILSVATSHQDSTTAKVTLQSGGVRTQFGNFVVQLARDYQLFAQTLDGASVLSTNAPAYDALTFTNDQPARLPYFGWLGPMRGTLFVADLGKSTYYPHSKLIGWKATILPHPNFELGASLESETGGNGGPAATFFDRAADLFPLINGIRNLFNNGSGNNNFSNKFFGMDARLRIPKAYGMELYADGALDDFDTRRLASTFLQDGGIVGGVSVSCVVDCGRLTLRAEYQQTGIRYYTHLQYPFAVNGTLLGDALGPRGLGGYVGGELETDRFGTIGVTGAYEVRSGNRYGSVSPQTNDRAFEFVLIERRPGEHRTRALVTWLPSGRDARLGWLARVGVERVRDFNFVAGDDRTNALAQLGLELRP
jgi:hypothetical protein